MVHGLCPCRALSSVSVRALVRLPHVALHFRDYPPDGAHGSFMYQYLAQQLPGHSDAVPGKEIPGQTLL